MNEGLIMEAKKGLLSSYVAGIIDSTQGEEYGTIIRFLLPELVLAFLLYSLSSLVDSVFISTLKSTSAYATLGVTNNLLHFMVKIAEAFGVGTIIVSGQLNGKEAYKEVGRGLRNAFWVTAFVGSFIAALLYFGAYHIYSVYGMSEEIMLLGVPFLKMRAIGVFFMFIYFALVGFLRGIKNTKVPMYIFCVGQLFFLVFDYLLIFGCGGFPTLGLQGSAIATVIQYSVMLTLSGVYILMHEDHRRYCIDLLAPIKDGALAWQLIVLSLPVMLDKAIMAVAYIWLGRMLGCLGTSSLATFCAIKDMERFALLPGIAAAQVITILVSNDFGAERWEAIKTNIKKTLFIASVGTFSILLFFVTFLSHVARVFDKTGDFSGSIIYIFPFLSGLVFFDLLQLVLSGALRGAGNVKVVMLARLAVCLGFFGPLSYLFSQLAIQNQAVKFILIYGSLYVGNGVMTYIYVCRFRSEKWKKHNHSAKVGA
jgi:MATE family multidrug resistance protein